jgi:hypothetical protein
MFKDMLSQRKMPTLGKILKGCDRLAEDAMSIEHPVSRDLELPIVSCERGFGALIIRPGVTFPGNIRNPVPLIQIPYSRIVSKYDLFSVAHEAGHDWYIRLGLNYIIPNAFKTALINSGAPKEIIDLYVLWSSYPYIFHFIIEFIPIHFWHLKIKKNYIVESGFERG